MSNLTYEQLVEKVSKAICMVNGHNPDAVLTDNLDHSKWEIYVPDARSAIATIAEATKERGELARVKSNANHISRMDPLTTLALIARIRELEAKSAADLADYETSLETMTAAHEAKVRELEAENDKLKHDIAVYINANSDLLDECDAARGRALEEAAKLADAMGGELRDDGTTIGMLQDCGKETANILAAQIRSLITKEGE